MKSYLNTQELLELINLLTKEKNTTKFLEIILDTAMGITNSDGGTIYNVTEDKFLKFEILKTKSLNLHQGGISGEKTTIDPIPLYDDNFKPLLNRAVLNSYHQKSIINIDNINDDISYDFSGTKSTDTELNYTTISLLTVPICNHENEVISILQLINPVHNEEIVSYTHNDESVVASLCSLVASASTQKQLIKRLEQLFESFICLINTAIDDKSPYTGKHCNRVPRLTELIANALHDTNSYPFKEFTLTDKDKYELKIASLLHDCGKIGTPIHIVDKSTKLESIIDRIELIELRFNLFKKDLEIKLLKNQINANEFNETISQVDSDFNFLKRINLGSEYMSLEDEERLKKIANSYNININNQNLPILSKDEHENLNIKKGTLNSQERAVINKHIETTINMLEALPWPKHLKNVPEYAGGHHEKMDGTGYPRGLTKDELSLQARCIAIADIFEALTAKDRPYKKGKTLSEALEILGKFKLQNHIDPDIFHLFVSEKIYEKYAHEFLDSDQIDYVDVKKIPGYEFPVF
ncbi:phosphohydrolase [Ferrovum sp. PN-J185]|uniref:HD-GYP domain-containing protein n=1 Tax=Ferrovum sp. PN-J185 TaxID=1356306 RepID=UPI001E4A5A49|nr:HD domain-containing phosphohydrolase [Ferrovum sp. PN-J185]MCC6068618.1 phosphohydrolase [Ferrovum sp. PN-J185]